MKNLYLKFKRKILKGIIGGFSLSGALFVFQCAYGPPKDMPYVTVALKSAKTHQPIKDIVVTFESSFGNSIGKSDEKGESGDWVNEGAPITMKFEDKDSTLNGSFKTKDTTFSGFKESTTIDIFLEEK